MKAGKFVSFEGLDGAGKSSHIAAATRLIEANGHIVVSTREPGGTPLAEKIRTLLLTEPMDLSSETLLMFAARQNHLNEVILPALNRGHWVVCDRFTDATYAYQGGGRGVPGDKIAVLERWVHAELQPNLTLLFDLPYEVAQRRIGNERVLDRFEQEKADFHERVRAAYLLRASESAGRIVVIDAAQAENEVKSLVEKTISSNCL